jgi:hypothetical protein
MGAVERIRERLRRNPALKYREAAGAITIEPPTATGFPVTITERADKWVVAFGGWHEHFATEEEALNCFAFGMSERCRLKVDYRGSFPHRWTVEERTAEGWRGDSSTGLLLFPFWRRPRVEYRQNAVIRDAEPVAIEDGGS